MEDYEAFEDQDDPDMAYERHLENAGWAEARFQEEMEAQAGVIDPWG